MVLRFTAPHVWIRADGGRAQIGLSDYGQEELGEIIAVDLPRGEARFGVGARRSHAGGGIRRIRNLRGGIASIRSLLRAIITSGILTIVTCPAGFAETPAPSESAPAQARLLDDLRAHGIHDARVLSAMARVPREEFVRPQDRARAYADRALPIAGGQTISQPSLVALMTQLLDLRGTERVLEIGTGSGYQAAVLSLLAQDVYSIEIDPQLADTARQRLATVGYRNVRVRAGDGFYGWEEAAPFDAVIITAVAPRIPERLVAQLKPGGCLVMPLSEGKDQVLIRACKRDDGLKIERFGAVIFVPMRGAVRAPTP